MYDQCEDYQFDYKSYCSTVNLFYCQSNSSKFDVRTGIELNKTEDKGLPRTLFDKFW